MEPPEKWSQNICQLNISWYHKTLAPKLDPFKNWFWESIWGVPGEVAPPNYVKIFVC